MTGKHKGQLLNKHKLLIKGTIGCKTHCFLHREQLAAKDMGENLKEILTQCVKVVNFIRASAVNNRIFSIMCGEMGSTYKHLLLHSHIRWLSKGNVLRRLVELRTEVEIFLNGQNSMLAEYFTNKLWLSKVAYLTDIFLLFNDMTLSMQGKMIIIFICNNKIEGFQKKIDLWLGRIENNTFEMFPCFLEMLEINLFSLKKLEALKLIIRMI